MSERVKKYENNVVITIILILEGKV